MGTVKDVGKVSSTASNEAIDLLGCFCSGIDDLVYEVAEACANQRQPNHPGPVQIEVQDVKEAGEKVLKAIRQIAESGELPHHLVDDIDGMRRCFENNSR